MPSKDQEQYIFRGELKSQFATFPNAMWEDESISIEAKGLLGYVGSRPPRWRIRLSHLAKALSIGRDKLRRIMRELIAARYVQRKQFREGTKFGRMAYWVYTQPCVASLSQTDLPSTGLPSTGLPSTGKPSALVSKRFIKEDSNQITSSSKDGGGGQTTPSAQLARPKRLGNEESKKPFERPEVTLARLAREIGCGDIAKGYELLGLMSEVQVNHFTKRFGSGQLSVNDVARMRRSLMDAVAASAMAATA